MSKRMKLTGGSGDVKPQMITATTGLAAAGNQYVVNTIELPTVRTPQGSRRTSVYEILKVHWYLNVNNTGDQGSGEFAFLTTRTDRKDGNASTLTSFEDDILDPRTFASALFVQNLTTSGSAAFGQPQNVDLTDGDGNGILVATDRLYVVGGGIGQTNAGQYICKIFYRIVNVDITEFLGIVQSQQ